MSIFLFYAILQIVLLSFSVSVVSAYVNINKMNLIVGSLSHANISGIGITYWINYKYKTNIPIILGMLVSSVIISVIMFFITRSTKKDIDGIINAVWSIGVSIGLFFIAQVPKSINIESYLFGKNILFNNTIDLSVLFFSSLCLILFFLIFYKKILFMSFDEDFLKIRKINTEILYLIILLILSITITVLVYNFGIIMVISLVSLPYIILNKFFNSIIYTVLFCFLMILITNLLSLFVSYYINISVSILIVFILSFEYILLFLIKIVKR